MTRSSFNNDWGVRVCAEHCQDITATIDARTVT
jgi:hypothetical protein